MPRVRNQPPVSVYKNPGLSVRTRPGFRAPNEATLTYKVKEAALSRTHLMQILITPPSITWCGFAPILAAKS